MLVRGSGCVLVWLWGFCGEGGEGGGGDADDSGEDVREGGPEVEKNASKDGACDEPQAPCGLEDAEHFALAGVGYGGAGEGVDGGVGDGDSEGEEEAGDEEPGEGGGEGGEGESGALEEVSGDEAWFIGEFFGDPSEGEGLYGEHDEGFEAEEDSELGLPVSPVCLEEAGEGAFEHGDGEPGGAGEEDEGCKGGKLTGECEEPGFGLVALVWRLVDVGGRGWELGEGGDEKAQGGKRGGGEADCGGAQGPSDKTAEGGADDEAKGLGCAEPSEGGRAGGLVGLEAVLVCGLVGDGGLGGGDVGGA